METFENRNVVVKALVGSWNANLNTPESDRDYKYFVMPTFEDLYHGKFFATAKESPELDYDVHDVRKLAELVWKANINFLSVLFSINTVFKEGLIFLFADAEKWAGMNLPAFKNATYGMHLNKMSELHKGTSNTQKLVDKFGYDTKQACHALRCLYVLEKYYETESMAKALWFNKGVKRDTLLKVKAGFYTEAEFKGLVEKWHSKNWRGDLSKAYADAVPDTEAKEELDGLMFEFIKKNVKL